MWLDVPFFPRPSILFDCFIVRKVFCGFQLLVHVKIIKIDLCNAFLLWSSHIYLVHHIANWSYNAVTVHNRRQCYLPSIGLQKCIYFTSYIEKCSIARRTFSIAMTEIPQWSSEHSAHWRTKNKPFLFSTKLYDPSILSFCRRLTWTSIGK